MGCAIGVPAWLPALICLPACLPALVCLPAFLFLRLTGCPVILCPGVCCCCCRPLLQCSLMSSPRRSRRWLRGSASAPWKAWLCAPARATQVRAQPAMPAALHCPALHCTALHCACGSLFQHGRDGRREGGRAGGREGEDCCSSSQLVCLSNAACRVLAAWPTRGLPCSPLLEPAHRGHAGQGQHARQLPSDQRPQAGRHKVVPRRPLRNGRRAGSVGQAHSVRAAAAAHAARYARVALSLLPRLVLLFFFPTLCCLLVVRAAALGQGRLKQDCRLAANCSRVAPLLPPRCRRLQRREERLPGLGRGRRVRKQCPLYDWHHCQPRQLPAQLREVRPDAPGPAAGEPASGRRALLAGVLVVWPVTSLLSCKL